MNTDEIIKVLLHAITAPDGTYTNIERRYDNKSEPNNNWVKDLLPSWNFAIFEYRITPEPKWVPLTWADREFLRGKWIQAKEPIASRESIFAIIRIEKEAVYVFRGSFEILAIRYAVLLKDYTFVDGSICGKRV